MSRRRLFEPMADASYYWEECDWHRHYRCHAHGEADIGPCYCGERICLVVWLAAVVVSVLWLGVRFFGW